MKKEFSLPEFILTDNELSPSTRLIFAYVYNKIGFKGYTTVTNRELSKIFEVSIATISQKISELRRNGYIETDIIYAGDSKQILERRIYSTVWEAQHGRT